MQNLNYRFVKTTSNYRQNPVPAFLFSEHMVRSKNSFNALALFGWHKLTFSASDLDFFDYWTVGQDVACARHDNPIYDATG